MADQLFKKCREARKNREIAFRKQRSETWLFVCEGTKTEPNYLNSLIKYSNSLSEESPIMVDIKGVGRNTETLVKCVEDFFEYTDEYNSKKKGIPYSQTFVLFDKDSFNPSQFNNAIKMAEVRGYLPIWSNECFELWYLLHYVYYHSNNGRQAYFDKLSELLGEKYDKADDVFSLIHSSKRLKQAMDYSRKLDAQLASEKTASKKVPCMQMFKLIEEIENRLKIQLTQ